jgi:DNA-directed RNA polymerase subunit RPC12/RpoP
VTVNAKKTEFICMGCWGTFSPQANTEGDVICPHCGARQELKHEPIDLDPEEFVDLGPELSGPASTEADAPTAATVSAAGDDDFDAVIEIDLDEIDANDEFGDAAGQYTEPIPEPQPRAVEPVVDSRPRPEPVAEAAPQSHFHLRTERGHVYTFLSPEALVLWARRLTQSQKALQISLDGDEWSAFVPFLSRLAATGQLDAATLGEVPTDADVSDDDLARSLDEEKHEFEVKGPLPTTGQPVKPEAQKAADVAPARGVNDFTFKVVERAEKPALRYAILFSVGLALGVVTVTALTLLGLMPRPPF